MHSHVYHHVTSPVVYGLNIAFSHCILMLSTNTRKGLGLILGDEVITKHNCIIYAIVAMEVLDRNSRQVPTQLLKPCFAHHRLTVTFHIDEIGGSIGIKGTSMKTAFRAITAITIQTSSRSMNYKLISEDFIARFLMIEHENAVLCWNGERGFDIS
jgi:hypothetical protein